MASRYQSPSPDIIKAMSIVLPRKNNSDFLAPSKALQDARRKLGPIYFDAKLIECPQNAVELSKLLSEWEDIDRRKFKAIEDTNRSQRILLHTLKSRYKFSKSNVSLQAIPDLRDIKLPPPGFRYHANGEPKLSLRVSDPKLHVDELFNSLDSRQAADEFIISKTYISSPTTHDTTRSHTSPEIPACDTLISTWTHPDLKNFKPKQEKHSEKDTSGNINQGKEEIGEKQNVTNPSNICSKKLKDHGFVSGESEITLVRASTPESVINIDYENEIKELEKTIKEINEDLEKNKIDLYENSGSTKSKVFSFLRAHARGDKSSFKMLVNPRESTRPNDRFAFKPGSSTFLKTECELHKRRFKAPTHGSCTACQVNLKHNRQEFKQMKKDLSKTVYQRWNYAPQGKIVEKPIHSPQSKSSMLTVRFKDSLHSTQSSSKSTLTNGDNSKERCFSSATIKREGGSPKDLSLKKRAVSAYFKAPSKHSQVGGIVSHQSICRPRNAKSAKNVSRSQSGHSQSTVDFMKTVAAEEGEECEKKVKDFLKRLEKFNEKPKPKIAFV